MKLNIQTRFETFCNVTETFYVSHADFKRFVTFCKRLSSDSVLLKHCYQISVKYGVEIWEGDYVCIISPILYSFSFRKSVYGFLA